MPQFDVKLRGQDEPVRVEAANEQEARRMVLARQGQASPNRPEDIGFGTAFKRGALESVAGNAAALPKLLMSGTGLVDNPAENQFMRRATGIELPPMLGSVDVPSPSGQEVVSGAMAGARALPRLLGGESPGLRESFDASMAESARTREENPVGSALGGALGDAATLFTGRAPLIRPGGGGLMDKPVDALRRRAVRATDTAAETGAKKQLNIALESEPFKTLTRGIARSGEAGLEGMALALLNDGDPLTTAAWAAGAQAGGSATLTGAKEIIQGPFEALTGRRPKGITQKAWQAVLAGGLGGLALNFLDSATPDQAADFVEQARNEETAYRKVMAALLIGGGVALAGGRRSKSDALLRGLPRAADAVASIPRGMVISGIEAAQSDPMAKQTMNVLATNPTAFTPKVQEQLAAGMSDGNLKEVVDKLFEEDEKFRETVLAPDPRLAGVPKED